jgi:TonB family protein
VRPNDGSETFDIDLEPIWPADDDRLEPIFLAGPLWFDFGESDSPEPQLAPRPTQDDEGRRRGPARISPAAGQRGASATSLLGSLGMHLLPLVFLLSWGGAPAQVSASIPVQLVLEQPAPEPDPVTSTTPEPDAMTASAPEKPSEPAVASEAPRLPKPEPPPRPVAAKKPPAPKPERHPRRSRSTAPETVRVEPPPGRPAPARAAAEIAAATTRPTAKDLAPGPPIGAAMTRDEYRAYLVKLTRPHLKLLTPDLIANRRGSAVLSIIVLLDGTIARIAIARSSGYPDIDARIEQVVAAVGRFPPLPPSFQGPSTELNLLLRFPDALTE